MLLNVGEFWLCDACRPTVRNAVGNTLQARTAILSVRPIARRAVTLRIEIQTSVTQQ